MKVTLFPLLLLAIVTIAQGKKDGKFRDLKIGLLRTILSKLEKIGIDLDAKCEKINGIYESLGLVSTSLDGSDSGLTGVSDEVEDSHTDLSDMNDTLTVIQDCACSDGSCNPGDVVIVACGTQFQEESIGGNEYRLTAGFPSIERQWCFAVFPPVPSEPCKYTVEAELLNYFFKGGIGKGHLGIAFNYQDEQHFDMIYFRIGQLTRCRVLGADIGAIRHINTQPLSSCPAHQTWFHLKVEVQPGTAKAYLDGAEVAEWSTELPFVAQGAVLTANGFANEVHFRNFVIYV